MRSDQAATATRVTHQNTAALEQYMIVRCTARYVAKLGAPGCVRRRLLRSLQQAAIEQGGVGARCIDQQTMLPPVRLGVE